MFVFKHALYLYQVQVNCSFVSSLYILLSAISKFSVGKINLQFQEADVLLNSTGLSAVADILCLSISLI